jgi:hypothetical protein
MKRRKGFILAAAVVIISIAVLASQKKPKEWIVLAWAGKAPAEAPPVAVLIEMGLKDAQPTDWSGRATISGAREVGREGYRFRRSDRLTGKDGWRASSHVGLRVPPRQPVVRRLEGIATVGVVLHLQDVKDGAKVTIERLGAEDGRRSVALKEVLGGVAVRLWNGRAVVRLVSNAAPVASSKAEDDHPAAAYGPDGTLWVAYVSYTLKDESRRIEKEALREPPANFKSLYTPEFGDQLFVRYYRNGRWSQPAAVTGGREDLARCAIAAEGNGKIWVVYSAQRQGNFDLYARWLDLNTPEAVSHPRPRIGRELRLTTNPGPDINPVMATDQAGNVHLAWQSWTGSGADICLKTCRDGQWTEAAHRVFGLGGANGWHPAIAAGPGGEVAVACDIYKDGDYDVHVAIRTADGKKFKHYPVATSSRFEARPALTYDSRGRLWIAYEEGPEQWGKNFGALATGGQPLYSSRSVRVACLEDGKLLKPAAELPTSKVDPPRIPIDLLMATRFETTPRYAYVRLGIDGKGRVWLTYRQKFGTRYTTHPGSYWLTYARRLDGDHWTEPVEVHHSDGLLDHRPVLLPHPAGGLWMVHNTDGRYTTPYDIGNHIYLSTVDLAGDPVEPKLLLHEAGHKNNPLAAREEAAVRRIRSYRLESGGKRYQLLRGEFHRHTEISWDGGPDGSLEDMFRYAIDAAGLDWIGNGDHDNGAGREYSWWLVQKFTDAFHVARRFTPLFCYERSVAYPHGHRNCLFFQRGVRTLPRLVEPDPVKQVAGVHADDTRMLYRYLKEHGGICAAHTSATGMGTDWRDNDPAVEPIVEIYQGDRMSYEKENAPRAGFDPQSGKEPANIAGWFPKGYVNNAHRKGYRLGFESSSDHWSTHISYCVAVAERHDRAGILEALRRRHCYAATDDIVVNLQSGGHLMGDEFKTREVPRLEMHVIGTGKIARIDILKDGDVAATIKPGKAEYQGRWTDPQPGQGVHYYYLRLVQEDGELAWASPMWIDYRK